MKFWTVNAFTDKAFQGNPAGVIILDAFLDDDVLQLIAREINLSETAFVKPIQGNHLHIRWCTPKNEVKLCGHATLSAAHILFTEKGYQGELQFESLSGLLKVKQMDQGYQLEFPLQETTTPFAYDFFKSIFKEDLVASVQAHDDVLVELKSEAAVLNYVPDFNQLNQIDARGIIVTAKSQGKYDFMSRFFAPQVGVNEDPVTGSAHCKLADYWQKKLNKSEFSAYQGKTRGGALQIQVVENRVFLTGHALTMIEGKLLYPKDCI